MSAIVPSNESLVRKKTHKAGERKAPLKAEFIPFTEVNPFDNVNSFIKYYCYCIRQIHKNAVFYPQETERHTASSILDKLIDEGLSGDERFLKGWITHYAKIHLRGLNAKNRDKTSLKTFAETLKTYRMRYISLNRA